MVYYDMAKLSMLHAVSAKPIRISPPPPTVNSATTCVVSLDEGRSIIYKKVKTTQNGAREIETPRSIGRRTTYLFYVPNLRNPTSIKFASIKTA